MRRPSNIFRRERLLYHFARHLQAITDYLSDPLRRLYLSLAFLIGFLIVGVLGYMLIERKTFVTALYMTIITVTTVGYGDEVPQTLAGRVFTIILIFLGIGAATTAVSNALELIVGQRLVGAIRQRRIEETMRVIENHYIVAGYGRIGRQIVRDILARGEACVIIDTDPASQADEYILDEAIPVLIENATEDAALERAGVRRARGFVAALPSDADNVLAILTARGLKEDLFIVARATAKTSESKLRRAGADHVISPYQVGAHRMAMALLRPAVHRFLTHLFDISEAESYDIGQINIEKTSYLRGQTVANCDLRRVRDLSILAIAGADGRLEINPSPDREFFPGDHLIVIGPPQAIYSTEEYYETTPEDDER
jgi:voltage-gated potassium channel